MTTSLYFTMEDLSLPLDFTVLQLANYASLIKDGSFTEEVRLIVRAVRLTLGLRRNLLAPVLSEFLDSELQQGSQAHSRLSSFLSNWNFNAALSSGPIELSSGVLGLKLTVTPSLLDEINQLPFFQSQSSGSASFEAKEAEHNMEVDSGTSAVQTTTKYLLPELEYYCYLLVLLFLIDQKDYNEAKACALAIIKQPKRLYRRTLDVLASRLYFYYSYSYELSGDLAEIRRSLLALHYLATLHYDELGQETLLNLLLRNYLHYNLYDQAEKFGSKALRFKMHSNQQFCRYLFYLGKIKTIKLEYTDAKESLLQADCIAPVEARGFRIQCNKWAILVRLLLGEIPERRIFVQKGMEKALRPYFELTNAVRIGDLQLFRNVAEKFGSTFSIDKTQNLVVRLRHNVIRTGLRNIGISYSRISLADVAEKLRLKTETSVADVESIIAKAIRDGAIDATLDRANGWMLSKDPHDIYSTNEPQPAFHSRITFCLNLHNEAVRALYFPPFTLEVIESEEERRYRTQLLDVELNKESDDGYF